MAFDPERFLMRYADAFNARDPEALRAFFALEDPRFAVFEDFSRDLFDGDTYSAILEGAFDATAQMSFDLLRADRFGDFAILHAVQRMTEEDEEEEDGESTETASRATMWITLDREGPRVVVAHFSALPPSESVFDPAESYTE